ncbi:hypothetical protein Hanom_Chr04g00376891 [Helianthus anomalus]
MRYKVQTTGTVRVLLKARDQIQNFGKPQGPSVYFTRNFYTHTMFGSSSPLVSFAVSVFISAASLLSTERVTLLLVTGLGFLLLLLSSSRTPLTFCIFPRVHPVSFVLTSLPSAFILSDDLLFEKRDFFFVLSCFGVTSVSKGISVILEISLIPVDIKEARAARAARGFRGDFVSGT